MGLESTLNFTIMVFALISVYISARVLFPKISKNIEVILNIFLGLFVLP